MALIGAWHTESDADREVLSVLADRRELRGVIAPDIHGRERLLECVVTEQIKGDVRRRIDGVAQADNDAVMATVNGRQFAFRFVRADDRNERRRRRLPASLMFPRPEESRKIL
jgi:hypothetical protein